MRDRDKALLTVALRAINRHIRYAKRTLQEHEERIAYLERDLDATILQVKQLIEKQGHA